MTAETVISASTALSESMGVGGSHQYLGENTPLSVAEQVRQFLNLLGMYITLQDCPDLTQEDIKARETAITQSHQAILESPHAQELLSQDFDPLSPNLTFEQVKSMQEKLNASAIGQQLSRCANR